MPVPTQNTAVPTTDPTQFAQVPTRFLQAIAHLFTTAATEIVFAGPHR